MKWQRFTPKFPLPIPFFSRSPYITILNIWRSNSFMYEL
jgi:hypothetical protein